MNYIEYRFDELPSTQDYLRELRQTEGKNPVNLLAVAKRQSGGKGTKGRSFECAEGGLWFSLLIYHEQAKAKEAFLMMARSAVAVCKTLEEYGLQPKIKWANDVVLGGKKVCGILTENVFQGENIRSTIFGIGLNVNNFLSTELSKIATTMSAFTGKIFDIAEVETKLLKHFFSPFTFDEYSSRMAYLGNEIHFCIGERTFKATLEGVTERGELILKANGTTSVYAYGEIAFSKEERI